MDLHNLRQMLRTRSIYDIDLRVTFYARVSTDSDEQVNSLENQIAYYTELIGKNPHWTFVPGYVDEGLSGATAKKREDFQRMVEDASLGLFDLVITKEITRFARNTLDSIMYTRQMLSYGVGVFFQNDNINTFDEDSELRLTIMSGIAQDELRKISSRVKFGHQQAIKNGVVLGNSRIFGYIKDRGRLLIDEEEAEMVRELFELYATDEYSMKQIEDIFWAKGYRNHNGKKISHTTMSSVISNPKYKGYYVGNKVRIVDLFTKKQKFLPPEEWVMFKDESGEIVPAIVSEEIWEAANKVLQRRSNDVKNRQGICNHANLLTGKLFCTHCGAPYYRRESKDKYGTINSKWVCSGKIKNGADSCPSFALLESEMKAILIDLFSANENELRSWFDEYIAIYKSISGSDSFLRDIKDIQGRIELAEKRQQKLLTFNVRGQISDDDFISMNSQVSAELVILREQLDELIKQRDSKEAMEAKVAEMQKVFAAAAESVVNGTITKDFVDTYIDRIFVTPSETKRSAKLDIRLFNGDSLNRDISKKLRMGHTVKKMIESYEKNL